MDIRFKTILLKNVDLYNPNHIGKCYIVVENGNIKTISEAKPDGKFFQTLDCKDKYVCPMFVDGHAHLTNDGKIPKYYSVDGIKMSGVGAIVGVLANENNDLEQGFAEDCINKNLERAKELRDNGIDAYCLTGSKQFRKDIFNLDEDKKPLVIGAKTALNSLTVIKPNNPTEEEFINLALETYKFGKEQNREVQLHIHLETDKNLKLEKDENGIIKRSENSTHIDNLVWIDKAVEKLKEYDETLEDKKAYSLFKITHAAKFPFVALDYANKGCFVDYTATIRDDNKKLEKFYPLIEAIKNERLKNKKRKNKTISNESVDLSKISISSDMGMLTLESKWEGEENCLSLLYTLKFLIEKGELKFEEVLPFVTTNPAQLIDENLGKIYEGGKARINIINQNFELENVVFGDELLDTKEFQKEFLAKRDNLLNINSQNIYSDNKNDISL